MLRMRSDEQLVGLLRAGHDDAFHVIYDRYRQRLFAYMRQMLPQRQDAEDALQEVFERAYSSLLGGDRELTLRPWLYRIAHNRCIDQLRRPLPPPPEMIFDISVLTSDPILIADRRDELRRLMEDVSRLPDQQRSALLMRELTGMSYSEVAQALGVTVPAVKSLLVRARMALVQAVEARDAACDDIRAEVVSAHECRVRPNAKARRHLRECSGCQEFRGNLRGVRRQLLALSPGVGSVGLLARVFGGGGAAASGTATGAAGTGVATGIAGSGGVLASIGGLATGAGHAATLIAAAVVAAGGTVEIQKTLSGHRHHAKAAAHVTAVRQSVPASALASYTSGGTSQTVGTTTTSGSRGAATKTALVGAPGRRLSQPAGAMANDSLAPVTDVTSSQTAAGPASSTPANAVSNSSGEAPVSTNLQSSSSSTTATGSSSSATQESGSSSAGSSTSTGTSSASAGSTSTGSSQSNITVAAQPTTGSAH